MRLFMSLSFYQLNQLINEGAGPLRHEQGPGKWELPADGPIPPAPPDRRHGRASDLERIANEIDKHSNYLSELKQHTRPFILDYAESESHRLKDYAEQLKIIANELQQAEDRRRRKDRVVGGVFDEPGRQS